MYKLKIHNLPSICIPRIHNNTTKYDIKNVFETILGKDSVHRVDLIKSHMCQKAFIHFKNNCINYNEDYSMMYNRLCKGENIKIVVENNFIWKCSVIKK